MRVTPISPHTMYLGKSCHQSCCSLQSASKSKPLLDKMFCPGDAIKSQKKSLISSLVMAILGVLTNVHKHRVSSYYNSLLQSLLHYLYVIAQSDRPLSYSDTYLVP